MADCKESKEKSNGPQPTSNMKYDPPEESSENSTNEEMEGQLTENDSDKPASPCDKSTNKVHNKVPVLAASKFANSFGVSEFSNSVKAKSSLLRPSQLTTVTSNPGPSTKTVLQPAKFHNPFVKVADSIIEDEAESPSKNNTNEEAKESKTIEKPSVDTKPTFLPLGASAKENENSVNVASSASTPSFVFGQNLKERVTVAYDTEGSNNSEKEDVKGEESNENGSSELLFSNVTAVCKSTNRPGLTLTQAAQEMEEATRANKRKYNEVALLTGEEGETNVLQINCKLFAFDKTTSSYQERGRGALRLNDRDDESRIVGRTAGTQRLILNTKVWPGMTAERAGPKSLRLTAMDVHGDIRIFIVQAAPKEIDLLEDRLMQRLKRAKERQPKKLATDH